MLKIIVFNYKLDFVLVNPILDKRKKRREKIGNTFLYLRVLE